MPRLAWLVPALLAGALAVAPACSSSTGGDCTDGGHVITPDEAEELENAREPIQQGTASESDDGKYKLSFVTNPEPAAKGDNTFTVTVKNPAGVAFDGADVLIQVFGTDGQDAQETPSTKAKGGG